MNKKQLKTLVLAKVKKLSPEKTKFLTKSLFVRTTWHLDSGWDVLGAAFCDLAMFLMFDTVSNIKY